MERSTPGRAVLLFFGVFLMLMIILPLLYPYGSFIHLDGRAGVIDNWSKLSFADPLTRAVYFLGDLFCHQEMGRTFMINGSQMAFCQRDTSVLIGVILGLIITDESTLRLYIGKIKHVAMGAAMMILLIIEWVAESLSGMDILPARVATGILAGIGIALILQYAITKDYEKIMFEKGV